MLRTATALALALLGTACRIDIDLEPAWEAQSSGVVASLRGVSAVDLATCWASGSDGTWLRTTDSGETWEHGVVPGAEARDFRDVEAFDADTALLMAIASPAEFWRTQDGGATWRKTWSLDHPDVFLDAMAFWDDERGLAWGDPIDGAFCVLATEDGGRSWTRVDPDALPAPHEGEAGFAASGTCLAVGEDGRAWIATGGTQARVLRSDDFGASWTAHETPMLAGESSTGGFSVVVLEDGAGALVGGDYANPDVREGTAAYTVDDGRTWVPSEPPIPGYRSCVRSLDGTGILVGAGKTGVGWSHDAGRTWGERMTTGSATPAAPPIYALDLVPGGLQPTLGWGVGAEGAIHRLRMGDGD